MVFERLKQVFGAGGPSVATTLTTVKAQPGGPVSGVVHVIGGSRPVTISQIAVALSAKVCVEGEDIATASHVTVAKEAVTGSFALAPGEERDFPFRYTLPFETPLTTVDGRDFADVELGLRTELAVALAFDSSDLDPIKVEPLPGQAAILKAFADLGFSLIRSDVERGQIRGVNQALPFYQEIEFHPAPKFAAAINKVEVTFLASSLTTQVILELDRRGGLVGGRDIFGRFVVDHQDIARIDWKGQLDDWIMESCRRQGLRPF
ncbi:sporulation-control protein [Allocatelliglobosispora scoriae]|uniref:Sporulation-control protein n=1 Tax=Allocatelliglobosispora scoriae TaxID=643052 RepID=A0A841BXZ9_9ACTN|nr:sporulation protein [Allocatelliglobosispora scoriae]MBB5872358.1 sporulation-control protein [Allocatelliglobosispora scoriae]